MFAISYPENFKYLRNLIYWATLGNEWKKKKFNLRVINYKELIKII